MTARGHRILAACLMTMMVTSCTSSDTPDESSPSSPQAKGPLDGMTVVVDPGHNGGNADNPEKIGKQVDVITGKKDCNTVGAATSDGYTEHEFNFDVSRQLTAALEADGATVVMTRDDDTGVGPCVDERAEVGNDAEADAVISVHADGGPADGSGFHIMEPIALNGHNEDIVEPSHELALSMVKSLQDGTRLAPSDYIGKDGVNPRDDMGGLNLSKVPAIMAECANMNNEDDADLMRDKEFRESLATALADGTTAFLTK